jgi:hypothetical protein
MPTFASYQKDSPILLNNKEPVFLVNEIHRLKKERSCLAGWTVHFGSATDIDDFAHQDHNLRVVNQCDRPKVR